MKHVSLLAKTICVAALATGLGLFAKGVYNKITSPSLITIDSTRVQCAQAGAVVWDGNILFPPETKKQMLSAQVVTLLVGDQSYTCAVGGQR